MIRIHAPFLGHSPGRVLNFVSLEPVVGGVRGYPELESSAGDGKPGLVIAADPPVLTPSRLTVTLRIERFANGATPVVTAVFDRRRPREVAFTVSAAGDSAPMTACILTATMGNFARLRRVRLRGGVALAGSLWTGAAPDAHGFFPPREWPADRLLVRAGVVELAAEPDEPDPASAGYHPSVDGWWRYVGHPARQVWRARRMPGLVARVNARSTYYGTNAPLPGGLAFENVEFEAPFQPGQVVTFAVEPPGAERSRR